MKRFTEIAAKGPVSNLGQRMNQLEMEVVEASFGANTDEEVSKIKNDNFHLQLELEQKNHEIVKLKSMLLPKLAPPAIDLKDTTNSVNSKLDPLYYYPEGRDFVTHFSSSSYEGHRDDINETSTVASTTSSNKKRNHMLFTKNILPFIRDSLQTYESSHILNDEILPIKKEFDQFYDRSLNKEERCKVLSNVLSGLVRIQRLNVAALNRELELKKIDRKMEYLATLFIDPTEFQLPQDKRLSLIKQQMLDVIIGLYGELPRMKKTSHSKAFPKEYKNQSVRAENTTKPELVPIGYMSDQKPKKRIRNIKLTPFKIASQES